MLSRRWWSCRVSVSVYVYLYRCWCLLMVQPAAQWPWYQSAEWTAVGWPVEALLSAAPAPALSPIKEKKHQDNKMNCMPSLIKVLHMNKSTAYQSFRVQEVTLMEVNLLGQNEKKIDVLLRISPDLAKEKYQLTDDYTTAGRGLRTYSGPSLIRQRMLLIPSLPFPSRHLTLPTSYWTSPYFILGCMQAKIHRTLLRARDKAVLHCPQLNELRFLWFHLCAED